VWAYVYLVGLCALHTGTVKKLTARLEAAESALSQQKKLALEQESELEGMKATYEAGLKSGIANTESEFMLGVIPSLHSASICLDQYG
jgi:hypothetical protein